MDRPSKLEAAYSWVRGHPFESDAVLAGGFALALVVLPLQFGGNLEAALIGLGLIVPLAWRRRFPVVSAAVVAVFGFLQLASYDSLVPADVAAILALYALAAYGPRKLASAGLGVGFVGTLLAAVRYSQASSSPLVAAGFVAMLLLTTWALGTMRRVRRREEERLTERARLLERERDQEGRLAATAERARIAREMHDVVAHSLSVTISQADGGRYAARSDPQSAISALETIAVTGRQALADMRTLLGVLRQDDDLALAPQPDTDAIPDLVEQIAASGLDVGLEVSGVPRPLPPGPALAAYRIVQESLTNVLKHGGPNTTVWVQLNWLADVLEVSVLDDGRGAGAISGGADGQGLLGMHERATLHGGRLAAGPRPGGGFGVRAQLPYGRPL
jgi:signal transduction histidine kinase